MSNKSANTPAQDSPASVSFESWRDEIETFCRHTIAHLQELISTVEMSEADVTTSSLSSEDPQPTEVSTMPAEPTPAPRDLDTSQDRLANLKRELAAKLSNASRDAK